MSNIICILISLNQGSSNYSLRAKSGPLQLKTSVISLARDKQKNHYGPKASSLESPGLGHDGVCE